MTDSSGTTETVPGHGGTLTWTDADGDTLDVDVRRDGKYPDHIGVTTSSRDGALLDRHQVENLRDCLNAWLGQGKDDHLAEAYHRGWTAGAEANQGGEVLYAGGETDPLTLRIVRGHGPALIYVTETGVPVRLDSQDGEPYGGMAVVETPWRGLSHRDLMLLRALTLSTGLPRTWLERGL